MLDLKAVKKVTLTEQIMEQIAGLITSGQLQAGQQLPNERDLAAQLKVTRGRVREALRALSLVGLVTIKAGEGSFVNEPKVSFSSETITWMFHSEIHNLDEVFAARKLIESEVYLLACEKVTAAEHADILKLLDRLIQAKNHQDPVEFIAVLDDFDKYMGTICGNQIYVKLMQTVIYLRYESNLKLLQVPGAIENSVEIRRNLVKAMQAQDKKAAKEAIDLFFKKSKRFYDTILKEK